MSNKVKFGLSNVHYAKMIVGEEGTITYSTPVAIPGAVNLSLEPQGEESPFYADNIKYFNDYANNGYSGDLEMAKIPDSFLKDILGQTIDTNGAVIENAEDKSAHFAFMFEVDGDESKKRVVYYNCTASRPSSEASTINETKEPNTDTLTITASARDTDKQVRASLEPNEENMAIFNKFYESVYEKNAVAGV